MGKNDLNTLHVDAHFLWREKKSPYLWTSRLTVEIIISAGCLFAIKLENRKNKKVDKSSVNIHLTTLSDKLFIYKSLSFKAENVTSHTTCGVWGIVVTLMIISVSKADLKKRIDTVKP